MLNKFFVINLINTLIRNPKSRIITIILAIIYVISPIDIVPELIPFVGVIDDGILIGLILNGFRTLSKLGKDKFQQSQKPVTKENVTTKEDDIIDV